MLFAIICMSYEGKLLLANSCDLFQAAVEISCEPRVRKHVRSIFMDTVVVSTSPSPDGSTVIDTFHPFAGVNWLWDKPLTRFEDAQWIFIQKAEEEKLLQVTIRLPESIR